MRIMMIMVEDIKGGTSIPKCFLPGDELFSFKSSSLNFTPSSLILSLFFVVFPGMLSTYCMHLYKCSAGFRDSFLTCFIRLSLSIVYSNDRRYEKKVKSKIQYIHYHLLCHELSSVPL